MFNGSSIVRLLGFAALLAGAACAQPKVTAVANNYSYISPGLPNYGIAQGSIFVIFGSGLSGATTGLQNVPLGTTLSGVSSAVTVNGTTAPVILYYVTPTQIAGILPSRTPVGTGTITVTNNGQTSAPAPITVVQTAFGILTLGGTGSGPAAVFDSANHFLGATNAAHSGDTIVLYGSGLGPVTADETIAQVPQNLGAIPILVEIGGRTAAVLYHGRSVYPGLDQINVVVPAGVSSGCAVTLTVTSGIYVSNFTSIPVADTGSTCPAPASDSFLTPAEIASILASGQYRTGGFSLTRSTSYGLSDTAPVTVIRSDAASASFNRVTGNLAGIFNSSFAQPSAGSCTVTSFLNPVQDLVYKSLDAGSPLAVSGPAGSRSVPRTTNSAGEITYAAQVGNGSAGNYLDVGRYTVSGPGGPDVGSFSGTVDVAPELLWTNHDALATVTRASGATVTWSGGEPTSLVSITGTSFTVQGTTAVGSIFQCWARNTDGQFAVPASVLLALPPSSAFPGTTVIQRGTLGIASPGKAVRVMATGLDYATLNSQSAAGQNSLYR